MVPCRNMALHCRTYHRSYSVIGYSSHKGRLSSQTANASQRNGAYLLSRGTSPYLVYSQFNQLGRPAKGITLSFFTTWPPPMAKDPEWRAFGQTDAQRTVPASSPGASSTGPNGVRVPSLGGQCCREKLSLTTTSGGVFAMNISAETGMWLHTNPNRLIYRAGAFRLSTSRLVATRESNPRCPAIAREAGAGPARASVAYTRSVD